MFPKKFPMKEQCIVIDTIEGVPESSYLDEICKIIHPSNIIFISTMSDRCLYIYLKKEDLVDKLIERSPHIAIGNVTIKIKRFCEPDRRIVLKNVYPHIPNITILKKLKKMKIIPTSGISLIKDNWKSARLKHVFGFSRQMFICSADVRKLPAFITIFCESTEDCTILVSDETDNHNDGSNTFSLSSYSNSMNRQNSEYVVDSLNTRRKVRASSIVNFQPTKEPFEINTLSLLSPDGDDAAVVISNDKLHRTENFPELEYVSQNGCYKKPSPSCIVTYPATSSVWLTEYEHLPIDYSNNQQKRKRFHSPETALFMETIGERLWSVRHIFDKVLNIPLNFNQFTTLLKYCVNDPENVARECERFNVSGVSLLKIVDMVKAQNTLSLETKNIITGLHAIVYTSLTEYEMHRYRQYRISLQVFIPRYM